MSSALERIRRERAEREAARRAQRSDDPPSQSPSNSAPTSTSPSETTTTPAPESKPSETAAPADDDFAAFMEKKRREREAQRAAAQQQRRNELGLKDEDLAHDNQLGADAAAAPVEEKKVLTAAERRALREQKSKQAEEARKLEQQRIQAELDEKRRQEEEAVEAAKRLEETYRSDRVCKDVAFPQYQALGADLLFDRAGEPRPELLRDHLAQEGRLHIEAAFQLIDKAGKIFYDEPNVLELSAPIVVVGDIHGQFYDLLTLMNEAGPMPATTYLFLGDYVDRGNFSTEVCFYLYALKCKYPRQIYLLRGNHECRAISSHFNFQKECSTKYTNGIWQAFVNTFDMLPLAAVVTNDDGRYLALHGGIGPKLESIDSIKELNRFREPLEAGVLVDILWADPEEEDVLEGMNDDEIDDWKSITFDANQARGCSYTFGNAAIQAFLKRNGLKCLLRGHSVMQKGYKRHFFGENSEEPMCITVFSAPNYCSKYQNLGAYARISSSGTHITTHTVVWTEPPFWLPEFQNCISFTVPSISNTVRGLVEVLVEYLLSDPAQDTGGKKLVSSVVKKLVQTEEPLFLAPMKAHQYSDNLEKFKAFLEAQKDERTNEVRPAGIDFRSLARTISSPALTVQLQMRDQKTEKSLRLQRTITLNNAAIKRTVAEAKELMEPSSGPSSAAPAPAPGPADMFAEFKRLAAEQKALKAQQASSSAPPAAAPSTSAPAPTNSSSSTPESDQMPALEPVASTSKDSVVADKKALKKLAKEEEKRRIEEERLRKQQEKNEERVRRRLELERLREEEEERRRKQKEEEDERRRKQKEEEDEKKRKQKEEEEERRRKQKEEEDERKRKIEDAKEEKRRKKIEAERLKLEEEEMRKRAKEEKLRAREEEEERKRKLKEEEDEERRRKAEQSKEERRRKKQDSGFKKPAWLSKASLVDVPRDQSPSRSVTIAGFGELDSISRDSAHSSSPQLGRLSVSFTTSSPSPTQQTIYEELLSAEKEVERAKEAAAEAERAALVAEARLQEAIAVLNTKRLQYKDYLSAHPVPSSDSISSDAGSESRSGSFISMDEEPRRASSTQSLALADVASLAAVPSSTGSGRSNSISDLSTESESSSAAPRTSPRVNVVPVSVPSHADHSSEAPKSPRFVEIFAPLTASEPLKSPRSIDNPLSASEPPKSPRSVDRPLSNSEPPKSPRSVAEPQSSTTPLPSADSLLPINSPSSSSEPPKSPRSVEQPQASEPLKSPRPSDQPPTSPQPSPSQLDAGAATPSSELSNSSPPSEPTTTPGSSDSTSSPLQSDTLISPSSEDLKSSESFDRSDTSRTKSVHDSQSEDDSVASDKSTPISKPPSSPSPSLSSSSSSLKPSTSAASHHSSTDSDTDESYDESEDDDTSDDEDNFMTNKPNTKADQEKQLAIQAQQEIVRRVQEEYEREAKELKMIVDTLRNPSADQDDSMLDKLEARLLELKKTHPNSKAAYKTEKDKLTQLTSNSSITPLQALKPISRSLAHMNAAPEVDRSRSSTELSQSGLKPSESSPKRGPLDSQSTSSRVLVKNMPLSKYQGADTAKRSAIESAFKAFAGTESPQASPPNMRRAVSHKMVKVDSLTGLPVNSNPSPPPPIALADNTEHSRLGKLFRRKSTKGPSPAPPPSEKQKKERRWSRKPVAQPSLSGLPQPSPSAESLTQSTDKKSTPRSAR